MLPDDFSPVEHLQDTLKRLVNRAVREEFSDLDDWGDIGIGTGRQSLRVACLHREEDTLELTHLRLFLFYVVVRKARDLQAPLYGIPITTFQEIVGYIPQVTLHFRERDSSAIANNRRPTDSEVSFRLFDKNISKAEARVLARKIKDNFATPRLIYRKGRKFYSYFDRKIGYRIKIWGEIDNDIKDVIQKVLSLQGHVPDWDKLRISTPDDLTPEPKYETVLGKTIKLPDRKPVADVKFEYAEFKHWGLQEDVILVDCTGYYPQAYERV